MRPLDPRLRHVRPARSYLALTVGLGVTSAGLVVGQALLIATLLAPAIQDPGTTPPGAGPLFAGLAAVVGGRAAVAWAQERYALRAASRTIASLRERVVEAVAYRPPRPADRRESPGGEPGPAGHAGQATAAGTPGEAGVATLVTRGLDDLEPYLVRYVPQLVLTALLTPALVVVVLWLDWVSAVVVAVTLPLVPVFMVLVGRLTAGASERRLATVARLGEQVLDLVAGLPTLRAYGRAAGPAARVRALGDASRRATMRTLRVAFLSSMVLELLTTLSVAIVAVGVGLRLVEGQMDLRAAIAVLVLAPEVYLPLRRVGAEFHASVDGVAAAASAFDLLPDAGRGSRTDPRPAALPGSGIAGGALVFDDVSVRAGNRGVLAPAGLSARIPLGTGEPGGGSVVALRGPSGSGKSTAVLLALGLIEPDEGRVVVETADGTRVDLGELTEAGREGWWAALTWLPQRPAIPPGTLRTILAASASDRTAASERAAAPDGAAAPDRTAAPGRTTAPDRTTAPRPDRHVPHEPPERVLRAARLTGLDDVVAGLPHGWDTPVGLGGTGLSVGQRQRLALTAALLDDGTARPVVVLDEPTAHLDASSEEQILGTVRAWRDAGRTVLVVAHRESLLALADQVIDVEARAVSLTSPGGGR